MLKRLSLAQAFVGKPELIFLDEPLANIDFDSMERVIEIIEEMKKTNFVVISHIWEPLIPVVDWVVVIANGKLVLSREAEEVQEEVEKLFKPHIERSRRKGPRRTPLPQGRRVDRLQTEVNHLKWKPLPFISWHQVYINFTLDTFRWKV